MDSNQNELITINSFLKKNDKPMSHELLSNLLVFHQVDPVLNGMHKLFNYTDLESIVTNYKNTSSVNDISKKYALDYKTVNTIITNNDIMPFYQTPATSRYNTDELVQAVEKYMSRKTFNQLRKELGITKPRFRAILDFYKIAPLFVSAGELELEYYAPDIVYKVVEESKSKHKHPNELTDILDASYHVITTIIKNAKLEPCYTAGSTRFYDQEEVKKLIDEHRIIDSEDVVPLKKLAKECGIADGRTLGNMLELNNIHPIHISGRVKYYKKDAELSKAMQELQAIRTEGKYKTIYQISNEYKLDSAQLYEAVKMFDIQPMVETKNFKYYEPSDVINALKQRRTVVDVHLKTGKENRESSYYSKLDIKLQMLIDEYLEYRENGLAVSYNGFTTKKVMSNTDKTIRKLRSKLSSALFTIGAFRMKSQQGDVEPPIFFDITTLSSEDILAFKNKDTQTKFSTLLSLRHAIKPFLYHLLSRNKKGVKSIEDLMTHNSWESSVEDFLLQLPRKSDETSLKEDQKPVKIEKAFLTREQAIHVYELLLTDPRSHSAIKYATIWVLSCVTGIRPEEIPMVRIEHFELDNEGYLKKNHRGWGILDIKHSKLDNSPSHEKFKTPISPYAVSIINNYLRVLYKKQKDFNPKGKGFLFRPYDYLPEKPYSVLSNDFMRRLKEHLPFLSTKQQGDFEKKAGRRSMNNWFKTATNALPEHLRGDKQKTVSMYQMRHKPRDLTTGDIYYSDYLDEYSVYEVLETVLGFPWDKKKLVLWELEKGYRKVDEVEEDQFVDDPQLTRQLESVNNQQNEELRGKEEKKNNLKEKLKAIEERLEDIKIPPKNMDFNEWVKEQTTLNKEKASIKSYLLTKN